MLAKLWILDVGPFISPKHRISHVLIIYSFLKTCCLMRPLFPPFPRREAEYRYKNVTFADLFNLLSLLIHPLDSPMLSVRVSATA